MTISFPASQDDVKNRALADFQDELPKAGPFLRNNFVYAMIVAFCARVFDNYQLLKQLMAQIFPDTATGEYLARWGGFVNVTPIGATNAQGNITVTGLASSVIPDDSQWQTSDGQVYNLVNSGTIAGQSFQLASLTRSGNTVTATTVTNHPLASGVYTTISNATQPEYNGEFVVTVTSDTSFIYTIEGSPATPATTTNPSGLLGYYMGASVKVQSVATGEAANLDNGTLLSLITPIAGVESNAYVQYSGIVGGVDQETDERYRDRVIYQYQNPIAPFNEANIVSTAKQTIQVDRVFVEPNTPYIGGVTVYFTVSRANILPTSEDIAQVKANLLSIKPANMLDSDVVVAAPTPVTVNFTISGLAPNTTTMQAAVRASLGVSFAEATEEGEDVPEALYTSSIWQTVDLTNGDFVKSFSVVTPAANITVPLGSIAVLGNVTFV